jgi:hypothetical protein
MTRRVRTIRSHWLRLKVFVADSFSQGSVLGGQVAQLSPQPLGLTVFDPLFRMHEVDVRHGTIGDFLVLIL